MSDSVQMVVVDGVRYRPEDAPKEAKEPSAKESKAPANKSRTAENK